MPQITLAPPLKLHPKPAQNLVFFTLTAQNATVSETMIGFEAPLQVGPGGNGEPRELLTVVCLRQVTEVGGTGDADVGGLLAQVPAHSGGSVWLADFAIGAGRQHCLHLPLHQHHDLNHGHVLHAHYHDGRLGE